MMKEILIAGFALILTAVSYADDLIVERPTYTAGDYWIFTREGREDFKLEFLREEGDKYIFSKNGKQHVKDFNLTDVKRKIKDYPGPIIQFPLKMGNSWTYKYEPKLAYAKKDAYRVARYEVTAYEQITVPAGTFWTFRINVNIVNQIGRYKGSATYWYAPDVKQVIKKSEKNRGISELKEFKIK